MQANPNTKSEINSKDTISRAKPRKARPSPPPIALPICPKPLDPQFFHQLLSVLATTICAHNCGAGVVGGRTQAPPK